VPIATIILHVGVF